MSGIVIEIVELTSGRRFPEAPITLDDGPVLLVEIERQTLTRVARDGRIAIAADLPGGQNGAAYVCNDGGVARTDRHRPVAGPLPGK